MAYLIRATCGLGDIVTRRIRPQRAVKQGRDYRRMGYSDIVIIDVDSGKSYEVAELAAALEAASSANSLPAQQHHDQHNQ